jgi:transglutaminase-like putative cysteine protease
MAIVLEYARFSHWRVPITDKEFNHVSDLCGIILVAVVIYLLTVNTYYGIYTILSLLPFLFFLLLLAQMYSTRGKIRLSTLLISMRRMHVPELQDGNLEIDLSFPYLLVCTISASSGNQHPLQFYLFIVLIFAWSLWWMRPRHGRIVIWVLLFTLSATAGYAGQLGVQKLQGVIEGAFLGWFDFLTWHNRDPMRNTTAIGSLGRLKLSDRIMVRVDTHGEKISGRILLRESTYTAYGYGVWTNFQNTLQLVEPGGDGKTWEINKHLRANRRYTISFHMDGNRGIIPVPHGINAIISTRATSIEASAFGSIMLEMHPGWTRYDAHYTQNEIYDVEPMQEDLSVPASYKKDFAQLVHDLGLDHMTEEQSLATIEKFFAANFKYSLTQTERYPRGRYLTRFLFETRSGHCEYFATATVLLLRAAGIPARYAVGYSIDEYSPLEHQYIGRANHAHSWTLAYINHSWRVVDTTPSIWADLDEENKSILGPFVDLWSWLTYAIATWDSADSESKVPRSVLWPALLLLFYIAWRMVIRKRLRRVGDALPRPHLFEGRQIHPGFHELLSRLEQRYSPRRRDVPLGTWITQLEDRHGLHGLRPILILYYRLRFDPRGLEEHDQARFSELVSNFREADSRES